MIDTIDMSCIGGSPIDVSRIGGTAIEVSCIGDTGIDLVMDLEPEPMFFETVSVDTNDLQEAKVCSPRLFLLACLHASGRWTQVH